MKITEIEVLILSVPDLRQDATSSSQDDVVVLVHPDEGITGTGKTDIGPWLAEASINAPGSHTMALGMRELLLGADADCGRRMAQYPIRVSGADGSRPDDQ